MSILDVNFLPVVTAYRKLRAHFHVALLLYEQSDSVVDIVFIHGLTGDRERTWRAKGASSPWPQTLLPSKIPEARVLTFGYDAYVSNWEGVVSHTHIASHTWNLLTALSTYREEDSTSQRPIIFVCHSLGGLVCEDALVTAAQRPEPHLQSIFHSTRGVLFLGTPHRGSGLARWGEILARVVGRIKQTNPEILKVLQQDSQVLSRIQESFSSIIITRNKREPMSELQPIDITCFYEELPLPRFGLVVPRESAVLPGYISIGIHANHVGLTKFRSIDDPGFVAVCGELRRWVKGLTPPEYTSTTTIQIKEKMKINSETHAFIEVAQGKWMVPFGRNSDFIGRERTMDRILKILPPKQNMEDCQRLVIKGLGGVGKTQIALEAAFRIHQQYPDCSVFWVPAVDATTFDNAYREIGRHLNIASIDDEEANIRLLVKNALSESADSWLLIVDNADDAELLFGSSEGTSLSEYLPFSHLGSILFTTRSHEIAVNLDIPGDNQFATAEMSRGEATKLLKKHLSDDQTKDLDATEELLDFLVDLPLAIRQASAYMAKTGISTAKYLQHCRSSNAQQIKLLSKDFFDRGRYENIKNPVATTWFISFEHIARDNPLAANYAKFMSCLAERDIPASLLPISNDESDLERDDLERDEAVGVLKAYAFISERAESNTFEMHQLVRLAMRNWLTQERNVVDLPHVIRRLSYLFPVPVHDNRDIWTKYLPHAQAALDFLGVSGDVDATSDLLSKVGSCLMQLGRYQESATFHRRTLELRSRVYGENHQSTLSSMNAIAGALRAEGKYTEAESVSRRTLELREKLLGRNNPDTLASMDGLAETLRYLGKYDEAWPIYQQTLSLKEEVLGKEHHSTLETMNSFALLLLQLGRYSEAEKIHREEWQLSEKLFGKDHPQALENMNNLALALDQQGKYEEAEQIHRQEWELTEKALGAEHPSTLTSMYNLAIVLSHMGKNDESEKLHRQTLELTQEIMGQDHPESLESMNALAIVLNNQGKHEESRRLQSQALDGFTNTLGKEHPSTLGSMDSLAVVLREQGQHDEAEKIHRKVAKLRERILGKEHPDYLATIYNLAQTLHSSAKYIEAEQMHRDTLAARERVLGDQHPNTSASRDALAKSMKANQDSRKQ